MKISKSTLVRAGWWLATLVVAAIGLFLLRLSQQTPPIPLGAPNGEINFTGSQSGQWDIYALDADGTLKNLTQTADAPQANDWFSSWSLDSKQINFLSDRTGSVGPTQINPDGANPRSLTVVSAIFVLFGEGRLDWDPNWSPDGRILWSSLRDLNLELYVMDSDGQNRRRLTDHSGRDWFPAWSPDGTTAAFSSDREGSEDIYTLNLASGQLTRLTDNPADDLRPVWSRDGTQILFVSEREHPLTSGVVDLWVMNSDGSQQRRLPPDEQFEGGLSWSPDGTQIVFMSNHEGRWHLYSMNADESDVRRLTDGDGDSLFPVWRP